ncbi:hypothetical protein LTR64_005861 [Lithohypha guttulata]|uniref:uncharacterized protein n=1 Tax=Lithohypha guttulata TaxID=1690604 RepID=UPI002DE15E71|nr:hypothetical protein LTR51_002343 [Lithohypha guttulata]
MAAPILNHTPATPSRSNGTNGHGEDDIFSDVDTASSQPYHHRFSSRFDPEPLELSSAASPSQLKRTIEAHLQETDRRLQDTQQLGTALLKQRDDLTSRLEEVDQLQDEATIPTDLRRRLVDIEREHADVNREVARALIGPKPKQDEAYSSDSGVFSSQATASPTKVSAPSRRHRNQPSTRAGDLQFAADISTSLLAQVRQLQSVVVDRDDALKRLQAEREALEQDMLGYTQKIRALDESEQKYKDENWNLETERHHLQTAARDANDKEKRLNAGLNSALAEKSKLQNDLDELRLAHSKLSEEHIATRKAHDTEIHGLKRSADATATDRQSLQDKVDELVAQNQELAKAVATRARTRHISPNQAFLDLPEEAPESMDSPDDSPPPSPTKATPRHGGLESETLKSSLTHAHRMIQNLKNNIHREKTEKIELKRMLQDARDELEHRRGGDAGSAAKRQKTKSEVFKKPLRPDMLGGTRRPRTDIELTDDDWEDHGYDSPSHARPTMLRGNNQPLTDLSDAYQTANDTEGTFDTADERNTTESEAFMTGVESLAGDSTDELTETEETASATGRQAPGRVARSSRQLAHSSNLSTPEDELEDMQTPVQPSFTKFKLRSTRTSFGKQSAQDTPGSTPRSVSLSEDSPATITTSQSPPTGEQSLFAELGGLDEIDSQNSTPARSSTMSSTHSTPGHPYTPSKSATTTQHSTAKPIMVNSSTMTDNWEGQTSNQPIASSSDKALIASAFPLPPSVPTSPVKKSDNGTQYTPQRSTLESPIRPMSSHITPPKTMWDAAHETPESATTNVEDGGVSPSHLGFSGVLSQDSIPMQSPSRNTTETQRKLTSLQADISSREAELEAMKINHATTLTSMQQQLSELRSLHNTELADSRSRNLKDRDEIDRLTAELEHVREEQASMIATMQYETDRLKMSHTTKVDDLERRVSAHEGKLRSKEAEMEDMRLHHASQIEVHQNDLDQLRGIQASEVKRLNDEIFSHQRNLADRQTELDTHRADHVTALAASAAQLEALKSAHAAQLQFVNSQLTDHREELTSKQSEIETLRNEHSAAMATSSNELEALRDSHASQTRELNEQLGSHRELLDAKVAELEKLRTGHATAFSLKQAELDTVQASHAAEVEKLKMLIAGHDEDAGRKRIEIEQLRNTHSQELEKLKTQLSGRGLEIGSKQTELETLRSIHDVELQNLHRQATSQTDELANEKSKLDALQNSHAQEVERLRAQMTDQNHQLEREKSELETVNVAHNQELGRLDRQRSIQTKDLDSKEREIARLNNQILTDTETSATLQAKLVTLDKQATTYREDLEKQQAETTLLKTQVADLNNDLAGRLADIETIQRAHSVETQALEKQIVSGQEALLAKQYEYSSTQADQARELEQLRAQVDANNEVLISLQNKHADELRSLQDRLVGKNEEIERLRGELATLQARFAQLPGYSGILSQETQPVSPDRAFRPLPSTNNRSISPERPRTAERVVNVETGKAQPVHVYEDATSAPVHYQITTRPLADASASRTNQQDDVFGGPLVRPISGRDQTAQNSLTADRLDDTQKNKRDLIAPVAIPQQPRSPVVRESSSPTRYPGRPSSRNRFVSTIVEDSVAGEPSSPPPAPRSGSASSLRSSSFVTQQHPPLPSDHRDIIAKASSEASSPTRKDSPIKQGGVMGPPVMPASAMRRSRTPTGSVRTAEKVAGKRPMNGGRVSRRSSVSSFASELDERFNIRTQQQASAFEPGPGTDPRMIQAITQTMIGEYLWKYTRKAGSKEMSATRHRRYFWVHPYTKTLYWSDQDPQTAGGSQLKAKSVQIESVRVITDDNPMPPGLHRKSLEVTTPGRKIKFTASTGQRHETWFNALSYLLHRNEDHVRTGEEAVNGNDITQEDIAEFSVNGYGARLVPNDSRMSMSSYNSRTTNGTQRRLRQSLPAGMAATSPTRQIPPGQSLSGQTNNDTLRASHLDAPTDKDRTLRASSRSRISKMIGSVAGRSRPDASGVAGSSSQPRENSSIYNASIVSDGRKAEEEEARRRREHIEQPGIEDVRACCDGQHHVGDLNHHQSTTASVQHRVSNAINRSMNRRT